MDIGGQGERGLTVNIDSGAHFRNTLGVGQFQQLNGLSADDTIFTDTQPGRSRFDPVVVAGGNQQLHVKHFYTQEAIVDSRENGPTAATAPLEVRFSVRHHDSIFVQANTVSQGPGRNRSPLPGGSFSSTDNPLTPREAANGLENGQASFIIPSLSIPVAFFPVRNVIPVLDTVEVVVRSETVVPLSQNFYETIEAAVSSSVGREEYFQIRELSPDPDGEDHRYRRSGCPTTS